MRILWHLSHSSATKPDGWSGAPGEAQWVREQLTPLVVNSCRRLGIELVLVNGDLLDHPEFHADYAAFCAPHYDANVYGAGGWFWGRAAQSLTASEDDRLGHIFERRYLDLCGRTGGPTLHPERTNPNVLDYYGFRLTTAKTPGILVEHGVGAGGAPDYAWLRDHIQDIADVWALSLAEFAALPVNAPDYTVLGGSHQFSSTETEWARLYRDEAPQAGIRAEIAYAQALKETSHFGFTGVARPEWNNPAGLGVTGVAGIGNRFPDGRTGVRAHLQHLLMYFTAAHTPYCAPPNTVDQRHFTHRGLANDLRQLDGRWSVPGIGYGQSIVDIARSITQPEEEVTDAEFKAIFDRVIGPALEQEIQQRKAEAIAEAVKAVGLRLTAIIDRR